MGYRIQYPGQVFEQKAASGSSLRVRSLIAAAFLVFSILVRLIWPEGAGVLREIFLPGDLTVTEQAFSELVLDLRHGQPVAESVSEFCRSVIDEAQ